MIHLTHSSKKDLRHVHALKSSELRLNTIHHQHHRAMEEDLSKATEKLTVAEEGAKDSAENPEGSAAPSKNALKKAQKEAEKEKKKKERAAQVAAEKAAREAEEAKETPDSSEGKYGIMPLIQSTTRTGIIFVDGLTSGERRSQIAGITAAMDGTPITLRARVHNLRAQGIERISYLIQAQNLYSLNCVNKPILSRVSFPCPTQ